MVSGGIALGLLVVAVAVIILCSSKLKINAFLVLIGVAYLYALAIGMPPIEIMDVVRGGFGDLIAKVGLIYLFGTIMGTILEKTGGALALTQFILKMVGKKNSPLAISLSGFVVSIPVNCDPGFIILTAVNKGLCLDTGYSMTVMSVALAGGLYATHTLVPPTAGPIGVAGVLGADLGMVIMLGLIVAFIATIVAWFWATRFCSKYMIMPSDAVSFEEVIKKFGKLPHVLHALLPILWPLFIICMASFSNMPSKPFGEGTLVMVLRTLGNPSLALFFSVLIAFTLVPRKNLREAWGDWIQVGMRDAALIMFVTAAGGAFGAVLKASPMVQFISNTMSVWNAGLLLPFIVAAILKTAQGSSTVAMITTAGIMAPLIGQLGVNPALCVLAIGSGAMCVSHTNDSYFWVVSQFSGFEVDLSLKTYTVMTGIIGIVSFAVVYGLSFIF